MSYRPAYLNAVELSHKRLHRDDRSVYLNEKAAGLAPMRFVGQKLGSVELVHTEAGSYWRLAGLIGGSGRAYATARQAAEALAITRIEGPAQCAAFDAERVKRQAS